MNKLLFSLVLLSICNVIYCDNMSKLPKCKFSDNECLKKAITHVLKTHYKGLDEFYLPVIDPLYLGTISLLTTGSSSPLPISIEFHNTTLSGLKTFETITVKNTRNDNIYESYMKFKAPSTKMRSNYKAKGRVLLLEINGNGKSISTLIDVTIRVKLTGRVVMKNNKEHLHVDTMTNDFQFKNATLFFDNLFNGNKELSDTTNVLLNQNAITLTNDMKDAFNAEVSKTLKPIINNLFDNISATDLFLQ